MVNASNALKPGHTFGLKVSPEGDTEKKVSPEGDTEKKDSPEGDTKKKSRRKATRQKQPSGEVCPAPERAPRKKFGQNASDYSLVSAQI